MPKHQLEPPANLAGIFERFPKSRWWFYIVFAGLSLAVVLISALTVFGRIPEHLVDDFIGWTGWFQFALSAIGVAFGFTAATNVNNFNK